jgi:ethanolamine utilization microcompartment shell protein EutL
MAGEVFQINTGNDVVQISGDVTIHVTVYVLKKPEAFCSANGKKNSFFSLRRLTSAE